MFRTFTAEKLGRIRDKSYNRIAVDFTIIYWSETLHCNPAFLVIILLFSLLSLIPFFKETSPLESLDWLAALDKYAGESMEAHVSHQQHSHFWTSMELPPVIERQHRHSKLEQQPTEIFLSPILLIIAINYCNFLLLWLVININNILFYEHFVIILL